MEQTMKNWWLVLLNGIIMIILSFFIFGHPAEALLGLAIYIGIAMLIVGLLLIIYSLSVRKSDNQWGWKLTEGILDAIFGILLLSNPGITAAVFPFVLTWWIL